MENAIHSLTLDLTGPDMRPVVEVRKDNARTLVIALTQGGRPYWIAEGVTAVFSARKPDGMPLFNGCTIEKNRVRYDFTDQTTNVAGIVACEILLYSGDEKILSSPKFELLVDDIIHQEGDVPESAPEISALTKMVAAGTAMLEDLREALAGLEGVEEILTQARAAAEAAASAAAAAQEYAEYARSREVEAAEQAARAENAAVLAMRAYEEAEQAYEESDRMAGRASAAADRAEVAATNAEHTYAETERMATRAEQAAVRAEAAAKRAEEAATGGNGSGQNVTYAGLPDKPKINGVELSGDKTAEELGIGQPTEEQIAGAVSDWLDKNPDATTTVQDGSISEKKLTHSVRSAVKNGSFLELAAKIVNGEIQVIHLYGDSITDGYGGSNYNGTLSDGINNTEGYCWANQLKKLLETRYGCTVVNQGSYGSTISNQLYKLKNNLTEDVDLVIWLTGTNNRSTDEYFESYKNTIGTFIDYVQERCELIVVSGIPSTKGNEEEMAHSMLDIDNVVMRACYEHGAKYVSGYKEFQKWLDLKAYSIGNCFADHVHPNDFGYYIIFLMICDALKIPLSPYETYSYTDGESGGGGGGITYTVMNMLTNCSTSNTAKRVSAGTSYSATITPADGYGIDTVSVTMGGNDITTTAYQDRSINIPSVAGDIVVTVVASMSSYGVIYDNTADVAAVHSKIQSSYTPMALMANYNADTKTTLFSGKTITKVKLAGVFDAGVITIGAADLTTAGTGTAMALSQSYQFDVEASENGVEIELNMVLGATETLCINNSTDTTFARYEGNHTAEKDANWYFVHPSNWKKGQLDHANNALATPCIVYGY